MVTDAVEYVVCYKGFSAASILLTQEYSGNPKPTASLYLRFESNMGIWIGC